MKSVSCIQKTKVISCCQFDAFIHGIIQAFVGFADKGMYVLFIFVDNGQRAIGGTSVYNDIFHVLIRLGNNALYRVFQHFLRIIGHGDDGELGMRMNIMHGFL